MRSPYESRWKLLPGQVVLALYALILAIPLIWMVMSSFKQSSEVFGNPWMPPTVWRFSNYADAWNEGVSQYFFNSVVVTAISTTLVLISAAMASYAMVQLRNIWARVALYICMGALVLSPQIAIVPLYDLLGRLGLLDTLAAMILPYIAYRLPMAIMLIRAVFLVVPVELVEASRLDGCRSLGTFRHVYWPMSSGVLVTAGILTVYYTWNEFLFALIFINSDEMRTIPAGLMAFRDALATDWGVLLAGLAIAAAPIVIVFIFAQRFIIEGMTAGSVKG